MDAPISGSGCKTSPYVAPMVIVLVLLVAILAFALWYYFAELKPRLNVLVMDKMSGSVGFKDSTGAQLLLQPPPRDSTNGQSSRITVSNPSPKSNLDFALYTLPIAGNTKNQAQMMIANPQGSASIALTSS